MTVKLNRNSLRKSPGTIPCIIVMILRVYLAHGQNWPFHDIIVHRLLGVQTEGLNRASGKGLLLCSM